jgi:polygalacturonase
VKVANLKIMGWTVNSDGVNPVDCRTVNIDGCFIRNNDDCFSIKLLHRNPRAPIRGCRNITIQNCTLWPDKGRSFLIGPESSGRGNREFANILFRNIDILKNNNWTHDWSMGAMAVNCGDGATVRDILIDDVRVEGMKKGSLFNFRIVKTPFNDHPGRRIERVMVRNVTLAGPNASGNAIVGHDRTRSVNGVRFRNLRINGKVIRSAAQGGFTVKHASNVIFQP